MGKILFVHKIHGTEHPSLSIEYLSAYLKSQGHKTSLIVDFNDNCFKRRLDIRIRNEKPDLIGFSVLTPLYNWAISVSTHLKEGNRVPIVFGNVHPTVIPEFVMANDCVDFVVRGEGEYALAGLINSIVNKDKDYAKIKNLCYKTEKGLVCNPLGDLISDLDSLPYPDKKITLNEMPFNKDIYYCLTERGCPYSCNFCHNEVMRKLYYGHGSWVRRRSAQNVIEELRITKKQGYRFVHFDDDCFVNSYVWVEDFVALYKKYIKLPFQINVRFRNITKKIASLLADAGCLSVKVGIQTTSDRLLEEICNRVPDENVFEAARELKKRKIIIKVDTMIHLPTQRKEDIIEDILFYNKLRPDFIGLFNLIYFPGSKITDFARLNGFIIPEDEPRIYKEGLKANYITDTALIDFMEFVSHLPIWLVNVCIKKRLWKIANGILRRIQVFIKLPYYIKSKKRLLLTWLHIKMIIRLKLHLFKICKR